MDKKTVGSNLIWRLLERIGAQGVTFIVSLVLARILDPKIYGLVALVTVITTILQVFVDSGMASALIQKKDADNIDFSTVFFFNVFFCIILYTLLFLFAPILSTLYKRPELTSVIRVLGIIVIISGVKNVQQAYVSRNLLFKKFFFATLGGTVLAGIVGVWMAYNGYGVWAIVAQYLLNAGVDTILLWIIVRWRPQFVFSFSRLKQLFSFGWKLLVSALIDRVWTQLRQLIIGVKFTVEDLAYFNKGNEFPMYATTAINSSIDSVLLPVLSKAQDDKKLVKNMTRKAISVSSCVMWPAMIGLAACAEPFIRLVLTDKWLFAVPYLRIFCISYAFYPIHTANLNAIKAVGRSDIFLILEIIKKIVVFLLIVFSMWFGVYALALSTLIGDALCTVINAWPNKKLLDYSFFEQIKDIFPSLCFAIIMGGIVFCIQFIGLNDLLTLIIQIVVGISIYLGLTFVFRRTIFDYFVSFIKRR